MKLLNQILEKPHVIFAIVALIFGTLFLFLFRPYLVNDETHHVMRTIEVADGIFYNKVPCTYTHYDVYFRDIFKNVMGWNCQTTRINQFHPASGYSPVMYIGSGLGIKLSSLFSNNRDFIFYSGRLFNLILYIIFCTLAIKITPVFKWQFLFIALFPMSLFLGMSYNSDSFNISFSLLYFAYIFKLIFEKKEISVINFFILFVFAIIGAFSKGLICQLGLLFFLPKFCKKFRFNRYYYISLLSIISLYLCFWWNKINYTFFNPVFEPIKDYLFIFKEPVIVFKKIFITNNNYYTDNALLYYIQSTISDFYLQNNKTHVPETEFFTIYYILMFISLFVCLNEKIELKYKITALCLFVLYYFFTCYRMLIVWNNDDLSFFMGIQGRYFIPMLPLLFVVFSNDKFSFDKKFKRNYKLIVIFFLILMLSYICFHADIWRCV